MVLTPRLFDTMSHSADFAHVDAVILCGGKGTRLAPVLAGAPKALANLGEQKFLDILINQLTGVGFRRIILGVGHLADQIEAHLADMQAKNISCELVISKENEPLGTGGALRKALQLATSEDVIAMNGDSLSNLDFGAFYRAHRASGAKLSIALASVSDASDYGTVSLDNDGYITQFRDKGSANPGLVNAGVYAVRRNIFDSMPEVVPLSLERDLFPMLPVKERYGFQSSAEFLDIGVPHRYEKAKQIFHED